MVDGCRADVFWQTQADEGLNSGSLVAHLMHSGLVDHRKLAEAGKHLALFLTAPFSFPPRMRGRFDATVSACRRCCMHQVAVAGLDPTVEVVENVASVLEQAWCRP